MSSTKQTPIRAVCFDLGGVIVRVCRTWAEGCHAAGLPLRDDSFTTEHPREAFQEINRQYQKGLISGIEFSHQISQATEGLYSPDEVQTIHQHWILGEYEGIPDLMDQLNAQGLITCALTNTSHEHWIQMENHAWRSRLQPLFASHLLHQVKPDPAIFQTVEKELTCTGPEIIFFDDTLEHINAAKTIGWQAHQIDPNAPTAPQIINILQQFNLHPQALKQPIS